MKPYKSLFESFNFIPKKSSTGNFIRIEFDDKGYLDFQESTPISKELVDWADVILCMEKNEHANYIKNTYGDEFRKKCYVLNIKDYYQFGSPELEAILEQKVKLGK
jgi:predicted protein tyrosine phosphatase